MSQGGGQPYVVSLKRQQSSDSMRGADTPTRLRHQHDVNSPKVRKADVSRFSQQAGGGGGSAYDTNNAGGGGYDNSAPSFVTQVARPAKTNQTKTPNSSNQFSNNLQEANEQEGCCWYCLPICGMRNKTRKAPTSEIKKANNQSTNEAMVNLDTLPPRSQDDEQISETDSEQYPEHRDPAAQGLDKSSSDDDSDVIPGLLARKLKKHKGKKCLVLDLDETLVHSSFKPVQDADFVVPVEIDGVVYRVYVLKRPYVDEFLTECAKHYELVVFTASLSKYANPLLDILDVDNVIQHRLFRESCVLHGQAYVKDLSKLGRRMEDIIFVDNSPLSYAFQPTSAIPILSWFDDRNDTQLRDLLPVLQTTLRDHKDVREILDANNKSFEWLCAQGKRPVHSSI